MALNQIRVEEFEQYISQFMKDHQVPGLTVAIAEGDKVLYTQAFGYRDLEREIPTTTDTIFGIASITKTVAAIAVAQLVEQGKMSFDDPVQKILPNFRMPGGGGAEVTVHHLLSHTSGMPPLPFLGRSFQAHSSSEADAPPAPNTYSELLECIANFTGQPYAEPGKCFNYSNECYALVGAIIKQVSGTAFAEYVRENILRPLGMQRTMISFEEMFEHEDVTVLYTKSDKGQLAASTRWPVAPGFQSAGRLKSCCTDLIRVFQMYANGGVYDGKRLLDEASVSENISRGFRYSLRESYAHALTVLPEYHGVTLATHGGAGKGISSHGGFVPEKKLSAVVLCNLSGVPIAGAWLAAINLALGLPIDTPRQTYATSDWTAEQMGQFVGRYKSAEGADLEILTDDGELKIKQGSVTVVIKRLTDTVGLLEPGGKNQEIRFYLDADGQVWGVGQGVRITPKVTT